MSLLKEALSVESIETVVTEEEIQLDNMKIGGMANELDLLMHSNIISKESGEATLLSGIYKISAEDIENITSMDKVSKENVITEGIAKVWEMIKKAIASIWKFIKKIFGKKQDMLKIDLKDLEKAKKAGVNPDLIDRIDEWILPETAHKQYLHSDDIEYLPSNFNKWYAKLPDADKKLVDICLDNKLVKAVTENKSNLNKSTEAVFINVLELAKTKEFKGIIDALKSGIDNINGLAFSEDGPIISDKDELRRVDGIYDLGSCLPRIFATFTLYGLKTIEYPDLEKYESIIYDMVNIGKLDVPEINANEHASVEETKKMYMYYATNVLIKDLVADANTAIIRLRTLMRMKFLLGKED